MGFLALFRAGYLFLRNIDTIENAAPSIFSGHVGKLLPLRMRLSGHAQRLPILWNTGDDTLTMFPDINRRSVGFFSEPVDEFVSHFQRISHNQCVNGNEHISYAAMAADWPVLPLKTN